MKTVKIDRKKWIRGGNFPTFLWDKDRNAGCCLGHVCKQISRKTENLLHRKEEPGDVFKARSILTFLEEGFATNNTFASAAMQINDSPVFKEAQRERKLIALFKKNGIKLSFYN